MLLALSVFRSRVPEQLAFLKWNVNGRQRFIKDHVLASRLRQYVNNSLSEAEDTRWRLGLRGTACSLCNPAASSPCAASVVCAAAMPTTVVDSITAYCEVCYTTSPISYEFDCRLSRVCGVQPFGSSSAYYAHLAAASAATI